MISVVLDIVWAVVSVSTGFLRNAPDYESGLETQLLMGSVVQIDSTDRYWCHVHAMEPEYSGWINEMQLSRLQPGYLDAYIASPKYICTEDVTRVWESPSTESARLTEVVLGDIVRCGAETKGRFAQVLLPDGRTGWMLRSCIEDFTQWSRKTKASAEGVEAVARKMLGTPYMWGGTSVKGADCSGLTRMAFFMNGILLPRNASQQARMGKQLPLKMESWRKGDLLFFGTEPAPGRKASVSHVAIYLGDGKIIHSSQIVRINSLIPGAPDYHERYLISARRILGAGKAGSPVVQVKDCEWYFPQ